MSLRRAGKGPPRVLSLAVAVLLVAVTLYLGLALHPLVVDDAFITYRYARNLASGQGLVYNPGQAVLSTTAPLFALALAAGSLVWPDLPALANTLSAAALGIAALLLFLLARREGKPWVGALAALLLSASPLLWLSLGLETTTFLALAMGAILAYRCRCLHLSAALLALAVLTRGDGAILAAILCADWILRWLSRRRPAGAESGLSIRQAVGAALVFLAVAAPLLVWLAWQFGSPLPATLSAKQAQSRLGITGFYPHTTYLEGLWILLRGRLDQTWVYLLFFPAVLAGLPGLRRATWVRPIVAWGAAHLLGYTLLGVTPYYWYYASLVPALVCLAALGIGECAGILRRALQRRSPARWLGWTAVALWTLALLGSFCLSDGAMIRALRGPVPSPEDRVSKVLPEAKGDVYRRVGEWLRDNTAADATLGVTEVGVMGYYSGRTTIDFLGLIEPGVSRALVRGDLSYALLQHQPDYLALTAVSPLYAYDIQSDPWFQVAYAPVQAFEDPRFWGSPVTVYRRQVARIPLGEPTAEGLPAGMTRIDADFGEIRLLGAVAGDSQAAPGQILPVTLYWKALGPIPRDYTVFVHLLGQYDRVLAQRDAQPGLGAAPTGAWAPGAIVADPYLVAVPETALVPDQAQWEVGLYDPLTGQRLLTDSGGDNVRFGALTVVASRAPLDLDFGPIALTSYLPGSLSLLPGETLQVSLTWRPTARPVARVRVTLHLVGESGDTVASASHSLGVSLPASDDYSLTPPLGAVPGLYHLELVLSDAAGRSLPLLDTAGRPRADRLRLTSVRLYPR